MACNSLRVFERGCSTRRHFGHLCSRAVFLGAHMHLLKPRERGTSTLCTDHPCPRAVLVKALHNNTTLFTNYGKEKKEKVKTKQIVKVVY